MTLRPPSSMRLPRINSADARRGDVLMEYVILTCFVSLIVVKFMHSQFFNFEEGYVNLGANWALSLQLLHRAIAFPIP